MMHEVEKEASLTPARMAAEAIGRYVGLLAKGEEEMARDLRNSLIESVPDEEKPWVRKMMIFHRKSRDFFEGAKDLSDDELDTLWEQLKRLIEPKKTK